MNVFALAGENEDEKLNEVMYEAWRVNRDCKLLRDGLQGLSWDGQYLFFFIYIKLLNAKTLSDETLWQLLKAKCL